MKIIRFMLHEQLKKTKLEWSCYAWILHRLRPTFFWCRLFVLIWLNNFFFHLSLFTEKNWIFAFKSLFSSFLRDNFFSFSSLASHFHEHVEDNSVEAALICFVVLTFLSLVSLSLSFSLFSLCANETFTKKFPSRHHMIQHITKHDFFFFFYHSTCHFYVQHHISSVLYIENELIKFKQIEYLVVDSRSDALISTVAALARHDCGPHNPQPLDKWALSTARRCARVHQHYDHMDRVEPAMQKETQLLICTMRLKN